MIGADSISGRARRFEGPAEIEKGEGRYFRRYAQLYGRGVKRRQASCAQEVAGRSTAAFSSGDER